jgi:hypothetical protein
VFEIGSGREADSVRKRVEHFLEVSGEEVESVERVKVRRTSYANTTIFLTSVARVVSFYRGASGSTNEE